MRHAITTIHLQCDTCPARTLGEKQYAPSTLRGLKALLAKAIEAARRRHWLITSRRCRCPRCAKSTNHS